jgi:hypothetical protein
MNTQLLELEEQVGSQKQQQQSSPLKKNLSSSAATGLSASGGHKKRGEEHAHASHQLTPRSPHEISSKENSLYEISSGDLNTGLAVTITSPVLQQLFVSLTQEINNWKLLASCRLMQSMKLSPLPTPRKFRSCSSLSSADAGYAADGGSEEKKEEVRRGGVVGVSEVKSIRQEVQQLKRYLFPYPHVPSLGMVYPLSVSGIFA